MKKQLLIQLSDASNVFEESPVKRSPNTMSRWDKQLEEQETNTEQEAQTGWKSVWKWKVALETLTKLVPAEQFLGILDDLMYKMGKT